MRRITVSVIAILLLLVAVTVSQAAYRAVAVPFCGWPNGLTERGEVIVQYENQVTWGIGVFNGRKTRQITGPLTYPSGTNGSGIIFGSKYQDDCYNATQWRAGKPTTLHAQAGVSSNATAGNNLGQVVGSTWNNSDWLNKPKQWTVARGVVVSEIDLPMIGISARPKGINDSGQVIGEYVDTSNSQVCLWENGGSPKRLATEWPLSECEAINQGGDIAGAVGVRDDQMRGAIIFKDGAWFVLPDLGYGGKAYDINNAGIAAGIVYTTDSDISYAAIWQPEEVQLLGRPVTQSVRAWTKVILDDEMPKVILKDGTEKGWRLEQARYVNDKGQIVAIGTDPNGNWGTWLLTPSKK